MRGRNDRDAGGTKSSAVGRLNRFIHAETTVILNPADTCAPANPRMAIAGPPVAGLMEVMK